MNILSYFSSILPKERILTDRDLMYKYETDESLIRFEKPLCVLLPENSSEISSILAFCYKNDIIVVPRGLGTGLSGGAIPLKPSVVLSLELMNKLIDFDFTNMMITVEPGMITGTLKNIVESKGLYYPPDPASIDSCSIGGNIAESSGGPSAVKYGTTRDYVRMIEFITPQGNIMHLGGKVKKDATGYNVKDFIIGSEGTLGVISAVTLSLIPLPKHRIDLLIPYPSVKQALYSITDIFKHRILPSTIEFMEERAVKAARDFLQNEMPTSEGEAHLLIRLDGNHLDALFEDAETIESICRENGAMEILIADSLSSQDKLWKGRRSLHDAMVAMSIRRERQDVVVPVSNLPALLDFLKELENRFNVPIIVFGHAGDGNVHINILQTSEDISFDTTAAEINRLIMKKSIELEGRLSGEHGIGIYKREYMKMMFTDDELDLQSKLKLVFDPKNLFNPWKVLP